MASMIDRGDQADTGQAEHGDTRADEAGDNLVRVDAAQKLHQAQRWQTSKDEK
jgi:hypothetical protein